MKTFQVKQKMWSLGGRFIISSDLGIPTYQVVGSFFKLAKTFTISDMEGHEVSRITKKIFSIFPRFEVSLADGTTFVIQKQFSFFRPRYSIDGLYLTVQGNFWDMDFTLSRGGEDVARIHQQWFKMISTYQVEVYEDALADLVMSLVIAIDYVKEIESSAKATP